MIDENGNPIETEENNKHNATENTDTYATRKSLWCINPETKIKTLVEEFGDPIDCLEELDPGILYVSHGSNISKLDIQSGAVPSGLC